MEEYFYNDVMKSICIISNIDNDISISDVNLVQYLVNCEYFVKEILNLKFINYVNGNYDKYFITNEEKEYSLIVNIGKKMKHSSYIVGKLSRMDFCDMNNIAYVEEVDSILNHKTESIKKNIKNIKKYILQNSEDLIEKYHKTIFLKKTILLLFPNYSIDNKFIMYIFNDFNFNFQLERNKLTYTKNIKDWNISNTLKYNNFTIGNFLIGKNIEFIFNMNKYINILNRLDTK